ncbi:MAG: cellulase family glycosylhydrolase [Parabacteroides sp.]|nr:cellulase family glycosylhydrolase [Parabacteroides sp.]
MKKSFVFVIYLMLITACTGEKTTTDDWSVNDFLKVDGKVIRNNAGKGNIVALKGINLGGWLLREGWMDPIGFDYTSTNETLDDYTSRQILIERFGEQATDEMLDIYQQIYIQESDLDLIQSMGLNFVRVPFFWEEVMDRNGQMKPHGFNQLDWVLEKAKERKMYVIFDLHGAPGGHSDGYQTGGHLGSNELWTNPVYQEWTVRIWQTIAGRYKEEPAVLGYDLLNEPVASKESGMTIVDMYDRLYQVVRAIDPDHIILMGAFYSFDFLCDPAEKGWTNVVYQTHPYGADMRDNHEVQKGFMEGQLAYMKKYRDTWNLPVYAGEYNLWLHFDLWETWMNELTKENMMWSSWTYKNIECSDVNNWGIYVCNESPRPDVRRDSKEEILAKWEKFASSYYVKNENLHRVIQQCAK